MIPSNTFGHSVKLFQRIVIKTLGMEKFAVVMAKISTNPCKGGKIPYFYVFDEDKLVE